MAISVHLFSVLAERVGRRELDEEIALPVRAGDLLDELAERHGAIADFRSVLRLAVNREYADEDEVVVEGDELALITPTSGG